MWQQLSFKCGLVLKMTEQAKFKEILDRVKGVWKNPKPEPACFMIYQLCKYALNIDGDMVEIGVYKGGSARLIAETIKPRMIHLFDTFTGMPKPDPSKGDTFREGQYGDTSVELVEKNLAGWSNIRIWKGLFPETVCELEDKRFSLVHIDCDIYSSTRACCEFFYTKIPTGAVMLFDDYGHCRGARLAVDEFFVTRNEYPILLPSGQSVIIKQGS